MPGLGGDEAEELSVARRHAVPRLLWCIQNIPEPHRVSNVGPVQLPETKIDRPL